uniref:protein-tyrosine-phosphatase n=1 Tax=Saccoglossus kowalevskii TaxID=10224 RepID=A0ABM0M5G0_SACKO|nr:PREDICTED: fibronectin-like [Saccoglossus kowalevskii]
MDISWIEGVGDFTQYLIFYSPAVTTNTLLLDKNDPREMSLSGLNAGTQYTITLQQSGADVESSNRMQYTKPNTPGAINQVSSGKSDISISWAGSYGNVDGYEICYYPVDGVSSPITVDTTSATITGLETDMEYVITVAAYVGTGSERVYSDKKTETLVTSLGSPGDVIIVDYTDTTISITWVAFSTLITEYTITYEPIEPTGAVVVAYVSASILQYNFTGLSPGVLYALTVSDGASQSTTVQQRTQPGAPVSLIVFSFDYRSVTLQWAPPIDGNFDEYELSYTPADGSPSSPITISKNDPTEITINSLQHSTLYQFSLKTFIGSNNDEQWSLSVDASIITAAAQPGAITVEEVLTTSIKISWVAHTGDFTTYTVSHNVVGMSQTTERTISSSQLEYTFTNLSPGSEYMFSVTAVGPDTTESVMERTYPLPPDVINVNQYTTNMITITWSAVTTGMFDTYEVHKRELPDGIKTTVVSVVRGGTLEASITGLQPDTEYEITIYTRSGNLNSEVTMVTQKTKANAPSPSSITVSSYSTTEVTLTWQPPDSTDPFDYYELVYSPADGDYAETILLANTLVSHTYTGLRPGVVYTFNVYTTVGSLRSNPASLIQRTVPEMITVITLETVSTTAIEISWQHATGTYSNYEIIYSPDGGISATPITVSSNVNSYTILGLEPGTVYTIDIYTISGSERSEKTTIQQATRGEMPGTISVLSYSTNTIKISWVQATGQFEQYVVTYNPADGERAVESSVPKNLLELEFRGLTPGQEYIFGVATKTGEVKSSPSTKSQRTKPMAVASLYITTVEVTSLSFAWTPPSDGKYDSYEITYSPVDSYVTSPTIVDDSDTAFTLDSLKPDTTYSINIVTLSGSERSEQQTRIQGTDQATGIEIYFTNIQTNQMTVRWTSPIEAVTSYQLVYNPLGTTSSVNNLDHDETELTLTGLTGGTDYTAVVTAQLQSGAEIEAEQKSQRTLPNPPRSLTVTTYDSSTIHISWIQPSVGVYSGYDIYYSPADGTSDAITHVSNSITSYTISGLTAGRDYFVSVRTTQDSVKSTSIVETHVTKPNAVPSIDVVEIKSDSILFSWEAPNGDYDGYEVSYGKLGDVTTAHLFQLTDPREWQMSGLTSGTTYEIIVVTTSGSDSTSGVEKSDPTKLQITTTPLPPVDLSVTSYDDTSITVTWSQPASTLFDEYELSWSPSSSDGASERTVDKLETSSTIQLLRPGDMYTISLVAKRGESTSDALSLTQRTVPSSPGALTVEDVTTNSLTVSWEAAVNVFNSYIVTYSPDAVTDSPTELQSGVTQITLEGLTPGETYTVSVSTLSGEEESQAVYISDNTVPAKPGEITLNEVRASHIKLSFAAADGVVDEYKMTYTPSDGDLSSPYTIAADTRSVVITGLQPNVEFTIRLFSLSNGKESIHREVITTTPDEPVTLDIIVNEISEDTIAIQWTAPSGDYTLYSISKSPDDGNPKSPISILKEQTSQTFSDLTPGREYQITVQTAIGNNLTDHGIDIVTERTKPAVPGQIVVNAADVTENRIHLSWSPSEGVVDQYEISYSPDNGNDNSPAILDATKTDYTFTGLQSASAYTIGIKTIAGNHRSDTRQTTVYTKPPTPEDFVITDSDTTSIDLSWVQPTGVNIDRYIVTLNPPRDDGVADFDVPDTVSAYTLVDLKPGREYNIGLKTVVLVGSTEVNSVAATVAQTTTPTPPQSVTVNPDDIGPISVRVSWEPSTGEVDEYVITYSPYTTPTAPQISASPLETSKEIIGLDNAQSYIFTITAYSGGLQSTSLTTEQITTRPYPPGPVESIEVTKSLIEVSWTEPIGGEADEYEVSIAVFGSNELIEVATTTELMYTFSNLDSFVTYIISVSSRKGGLMSQASTFQQRTFPDVPGPVRDFKVALDDLTVVASFKAPEKPNSIIEMYIIKSSGTSTIDGDVHNLNPVLIVADPTVVEYTDQRFAGLRAGYTYTFTIQAKSDQGNSTEEPSVPRTLTLPISPPPVPEASSDALSRQLFKSSTHKTITITLWDDLFDDSRGPILSYSILVAEASAKPLAASDEPLGWTEVQSLTPWPIYQTSERFNPFTSDSAGRRKKRASQADYVIGSEDCALDTDKYCNGPLQPLSQYVVKVRAYVDQYQYTDTEWTSSLSTEYDPWWFGYAVIGIVALGIIVILIIVCWRCCCAQSRRRAEDYRYKRSIDGVENPAYVRNTEVRRESPTFVMREARQPAPVQKSSVSAASSQKNVTIQTKPQGLSRPVRISKYADHYRQMAADSEYRFQEEYDVSHLFSKNHY